MSSAKAGSLGALRERNRSRVIETLRREGVVSRADIARRTGLSRTTVSSLVGDLLTAGLVTERALDDRAAHAGRPPVMISLDQSAGVALGINFGHRHLRVALADLSSAVIGEVEREIDGDRAGSAGLDAAAELAEVLLGEAGVEPARVIGAGMGLSGPIDHVTGRAHASAILPGWVEVEAQRGMEARLGVPVRLENDANLGALAEVAFGAGRGASNLVYLLMSSGIGAGLFLDGRLLRGAVGTAGEVGHTLVDEGGPLCRCGNRGCLETFAAAPALVELVSRARGETVGLTRMLELAAEGDTGARRVIADAGRVSGRALANLCNQLNPELIVVGGRLAQAGDVLLDPLRESVQRYAITPAADAVSVVPSLLGARAEVLGALALVIRQSDPLFATPIHEARIA